MQFISTVHAAAGTSAVEVSKLYNPSNIPVTSNISDLLTKGGVNILNLFFVFAGLFFFVNLVLAGWDFMMSSGDPKKVSAASTRITNGFIGIIMTLTAFVVVRIIVAVLGLQPVI